ncbi:LOW QUALITY PROTEIN: hypothetical protein HZS_341 [Henneguya salminicola]|nr:LOW QUALITY PROTEIN: hypothetical protein HZS_341 [Henneguya salminicola]
MDRTLNTVPLLQPYTIHRTVDQTNMRILPLVYILLTSKTHETYHKSFDFLLDIAFQNQILLNPPYIISEFGLASINASRTLFQNSIHKC